MHIYRIIMLSLSFILGSIFATIGSLDIHAASSCGWLWSDPTCASANKINIDCGAGGCTLSGGIKIVETVTDKNLSNKPIHLFITDIIRYFLSFVTLIAVIYVIYAGFRLMVSGGDEEASKKSRQIIIYVIAGIIIMWTAFWIVKLLIQAFN